MIDTKVRISMISPGLVETNFSLVRFKGDKEQAKIPYKGITPLVAADIADNIFYIVSRPEHVQIADLVVFPSAQASVYHFYRE